MDVLKEVTRILDNVLSLGGRGDRNHQDRDHQQGGSAHRESS